MKTALVIVALLNVAGYFVYDHVQEKRAAEQAAREAHKARAEYVFRSVVENLSNVNQ